MDALFSHFKENREVKGEYSSKEDALYLETHGSFKGRLYSKPFSYDGSTGTLIYGEERVEMPVKNGKLHIFIDHEVTEISTDDWKKLASFENGEKRGYDDSIKLTLNETVLKEYIWR